MYKIGRREPSWLDGGGDPEPCLVGPHYVSARFEGPPVEQRLKFPVGLLTLKAPPGSETVHVSPR